MSGCLVDLVMEIGVAGCLVVVNPLNPLTRMLMEIYTIYRFD